MKAPALLLSLSVFAPFCTMAALPPCLDDASGRLTVRFCNRLEVLDIDTDRFDATRATGEVNTVRTGAKSKISELSTEAANYQQNTGLATQLTGWVAGKPRKDSTWRAINSQLFVELLPSVDRGDRKSVV